MNKGSNEWKAPPKSGTTLIFFSIDIGFSLPLVINNLFFKIDLSAETVNDEFGQRHNKPRRQVDFLNISILFI